MSTCWSVAGPAAKVCVDPDSVVALPHAVVQVAETVALANPERSSVTCITTAIAPGSVVTSTLAGSAANAVRTGGVVSAAALAAVAAMPLPTVATVVIAAKKAMPRSARRWAETPDCTDMTRPPPAIAWAQPAEMALGKPWAAVKAAAGSGQELAQIGAVPALLQRLRM